MSGNPVDYSSSRRPGDKVTLVGVTDLERKRLENEQKNLQEALRIKRWGVFTWGVISLFMAANAAAMSYYEIDQWRYFLLATLLVCILGYFDGGNALLAQLIDQQMRHKKCPRQVTTMGRGQEGIERAVNSAHGYERDHQCAGQHQTHDLHRQ